MTAVVMGDLNVDLELLLPGESSNLGHANPEPVLTRGGSSANTAGALASLGIATRFVGAVGDDAYGATAIDMLASTGVDVSRVRVLEGATVMVIVVLRPDGERLIYVWPPRGGAHLGVTSEAAVAGIRGASWFHVSGIALRGEPAAASIIEAMGVARSRRIPVSLDLNLRLENWGWEDGFRQTIATAVSLADVVFGGIADEMVPYSGATDPEKAVADVARSGCLAVGRIGAGGAIAHDGRMAYRAAAFAVDVVDTVGAGDAFDAGFIAARLGGASLDDALMTANAVAALTLGRRGAEATPSAATVARFLEERRGEAPAG